MKCRPVYRLASNSDCVQLLYIALLRPGDCRSRPLAEGIEAVLMLVHQGYLVTHGESTSPVQRNGCRTLPGLWTAGNSADGAPLKSSPRPNVEVEERRRRWGSFSRIRGPIQPAGSFPHVSDFAPERDVEWTALGAEAAYKPQPGLEYQHRHAGTGRESAPGTGDDDLRVAMITVPTVNDWDVEIL